MPKQRVCFLTWKGSGLCEVLQDVDGNSIIVSLLQNITNFLHAFLIFSNSKLSKMGCPNSATSSAMDGQHPLGLPPTRFVAMERIRRPLKNAHLRTEISRVMRV